MGDTLDRLRAFLDHPAPGLVFAAHKRAGLPERAYATPHRAGGALAKGERRELERLAAAEPSALAALLDVYGSINGAGFCELRDSLNDTTVPALRLLPVREWKEATEPWVEGEMAGFMEGCESYSKGEWRVIGHLPSEEQSLVIFFSGQHEGEKLAGRMFCIGLDGVMGYEEELAPDFGAFVEQFAADPAAVFERIGFSWVATAADGSIYGDPVGSYVPDVRGHPSLREWPG